MQGSTPLRHRLAIGVQPSTTVTRFVEKSRRRTGHVGWCPSGAVTDFSGATGCEGSLLVFDRQRGVTTSSRHRALKPLSRDSRSTH